MGGSHRTVYWNVLDMEEVGEGIVPNKQGGREHVSEVTSEVYPLGEQSERNLASVGSSQLFWGGAPPTPACVRKYFGIKKKKRHSIFYCATLTLVNLRLAELGFPGKPQARVQMLGTGLHPAFRPA